MHAMVMLGLILVASFLASFTDWVFMDMLIHRYYRETPQIWRPLGGARRIIVSQIIATAASAAVILLCRLAPGRPLFVVGAVFFAGPCPVILQNLQWIRMPVAVAAGHATAWLLRLLIAAELTAWLLPT